MVNKLIDGVSFLKNKLKTDELQEKLTEAVSDQNWQASTQLLHQIANASYNYQKEQKILAFIWDKLKHKNWKKVLKTLHLVDFLIKYGPTSTIEMFKENIYEFRNLDNYSAFSEGIDRGESIRKQSKTIINILSDEQQLNDERAKAKQIKERMAQVIGTGVYYGSYSNDGISGNQNINKPKSDSYQSFNSNSYQFGGTHSGSMSFGESVVKSLQSQKRPQQSYVPNNTQKAPSKLNIGKMIQKKAEKEEQKKTFKLVKPPEKKPIDKKSQQTPAPHVKPQNVKPAGKVNIMDLDIIDFNEPITTKSEANVNSNVDSFDFLGGPVASQNSPQINTNYQKNPIFQQLPKTNNSIPTTNILPINPTYFNSSPTPNIYQPPPPPPPQSYISYPQQGSTPIQIVYPNQQFNLGINLNPQPQNLTQPQTKGITLNLNQQKLPEKNTNSLIDFSNFRQQLNSFGKTSTKQQNPIQSWNW